MRWFAMIGLIALTGCMAPLAPSPQTPGSSARAPKVTKPERTPEAVVAQFVDVVSTVEPVAERVCREKTRNVNCDFIIAVDDRTDQPPNAFQTLDRNGRPVIAFTVALIAEVRNADELAFVMSHEAAHHIAGHISRMQQNATVGAVLAGGLASLSGGNADAVRTAQDIGASVGARSYSKDFELEADALGTRIAMRAGYDPVRGAQYFTRIPDPGNRFLGTHPPNDKRIRTVQRVAAGL